MAKNFIVVLAGAIMVHAFTTVALAGG